MLRIAISSVFPAKFEKHGVPGSVARNPVKHERGEDLDYKNNQRKKKT